MPSLAVIPVLDGAVRKLCTKPYRGHPKGCPNFAKRPDCPPAAPRFADIYDMSRSIIAVWNEFDFAAHTSRMRAKHPEWSKAQVECCLYWQGTARKQLRGEISKALNLRPGMCSETCPEAMGINVTATMGFAGVKLEWPPVTKAIQVALLAYPIQSFPVTDPKLDAPRGAVVDGYVRRTATWERVTPEKKR